MCDWALKFKQGLTSQLGGKGKSCGAEQNLEAME